MTDADLEDVLLRSANNNERADLTGVLLYNEGTFFQYLEGPPEAVDGLMSRLPKDKRHSGIIVLLEDTTKNRIFPDWSMALFKPRQSDLLNLVNQEWWEFSGERLERSWMDSPAANLLRGLCESQRATTNLASN